MKGRLVAALVVGLLVGMALPTLFRPPEAQAQRRERSQDWEYRVQFFGYSPRDPSMPAISTRFSEEMNRLARDGWVYFGPAQLPGGTTGGFLIFRRAKK